MINPHAARIFRAVARQHITPFEWAGAPIRPALEVTKPITPSRGKRPALLRLSPIRNTEEASCRRRKKPPNLTHCTVSFRAIKSLLSGVHVMNVVGEILTKLFAIGIAGA